MLHQPLRQWWHEQCVRSLRSGRAGFAPPRPPPRSAARCRSVFSGNGPCGPPGFGPRAARRRR
eukprot:10993584-Lingulodinium_polyedra.AAC.1